MDAMDDIIPSLVPASEEAVKGTCYETTPSYAIVEPSIKVPMTILTGFLGAGKSTLLKRILEERHGWKIAIIMNELGPTGGVDRAMITEKVDKMDEEWLEVENGCLCCTAKNETFLAIESLLLRRPDIEHVIIESSGAADPSALVQKLWIDEALESRVTLNAVICVVDSTNTETMLSPTSLHYSIEAARQVAIADYIMLNKMDLVVGGQLEIAKKLVGEINPVAKITTCQFSSVSIDQILNLREYYSNQVAASENKIDDILDMLGRAKKLSLSNHSSQTIRSFTIYLKKALEYEKFERWLFILLWERRIAQTYLPETDLIMRIKGIVVLQRTNDESPKRYYLQVVQDKYELEPFRDQRTEKVDEATSTIIFIGRIEEDTEDLIKTTINQCF